MTVGICEITSWVWDMIFFTEAENLSCGSARPGEPNSPGWVLQASNTFSSVKQSDSSSFSSHKPSPTPPSSSSTTTDHRWPSRAAFAYCRITARRRIVWSERNLQNSTRGFGREWTLQSFLHDFFEVIVILNLLLISLSLSLHLIWLGSLLLVSLSLSLHLFWLGNHY